MSEENKKYELLQDDTVTTPSGETLYRIKALVAIGLLVSPGELGGYVESTQNLDIYGNAWVAGNAWVSGNARVFGNARMFLRNTGTIPGGGKRKTWPK